MADIIALTPTNKGHRIWIQALASKGITAPRFTVDIAADTITISVGNEGKRGVTQLKGGIIDIQSKKVTTWARGATCVHMSIHTVNDVSIITLTRGSL